MERIDIPTDRRVATERFWHAANYVSLALIYLRANTMLQRRLVLDDVKPRATGHWGCVPALNFVWSNLLSVVRATGTDVRLFLGTGHAGVSWLACSYLEGSLSAYHPFGDDEASLSRLAAAFGRSGGFTTELSAQYPGVLWSSGELGYALSLAHGHALSATDSTVVAVLGDGELETAPTCGALAAIRAHAPVSARLIIIVNVNGFRMGGPSEISTWSEERVREHFAGFAVTLVDGFDTTGFSKALEYAVRAPYAECAPAAIVLRTAKGATIPSGPDGSPVAGTVRAHKAPVKAIRDAAGLAWLQNMLHSYHVDEIFAGGTLRRTAFASILPPRNACVAMVRERLCCAARPRVLPRIVREPDAAMTSIDVFAASVRSAAEAEGSTCLIASPDELSSNRLEAIASPNVEIREYLSEHQCLAWCIGAAIAGRIAWFPSYDAFAPIVAPIITQYLKFLDCSLDAPVPVDDSPVNVLLTSLGWRNVFSHQDPGFASSLLEKRFASLRCFLPASPASMAAVLESIRHRNNTVNCVVADKYPICMRGNPMPLARGDPFSLVGTWGWGNAEARQVTVIAAGDYVAREAAFAARAVATHAGDIRARAVVVEELTWLYRASPVCEAERARFTRMVADSAAVVVVTSLYEDVVANLVRALVPRSARFVAHGFCSSATQMTALGMLLASGSSWVQIAAEVLRLFERAEYATALDRLQVRIRSDLAESYDDPDWYWELDPDDRRSFHSSSVGVV